MPHVSATGTSWVRPPYPDGKPPASDARSSYLRKKGQTTFVMPHKKTLHPTGPKLIDVL